MSSSSDYVAIPRCPVIFDDANYPDFAAFMRVHMRGLRLWGVLSGEVSYLPRPVAPTAPTAPTSVALAPDATQAVKDAAKSADDTALADYDRKVQEHSTAVATYRLGLTDYTQWIDVDARVVAVLTSSVLPHYVVEFMGLPTAAAQWAFLCQRYQSFGDALYLSVVRQEHALQQDDSTIDEFYTQSDAIWRQLDSLCTAVCATCPCCLTVRADLEFQRIFEFLSWLRKEFEPRRAQLLARGRVPLFEVLDELRAEETRLLEVPSSLAARGPRVPYAHGPHVSSASLRSQVPPILSTPPTQGQSQPQQSRGMTTPPRPPCAYCGNSGHDVSSCWRRDPSLRQQYHARFSSSGTAGSVLSSSGTARPPPSTQSGTSSLWHGVDQPRNPWYDGPEYITQCPIQPGANLTYTIILSKEEGTLWWHAHIDYDRTTIHGAIVIHPKLGTTFPFKKPHKEIPVILSEWWNADVNSCLRRLGGLAARSVFQTLTPSTANHETLFPCGKTYLLRIINSGLANDLFFGVAVHRLTVVGTDARYTKPFTVDHIFISPGQTVDALLEADRATNGSSNGSTATAILEYADARAGTPDLRNLPAINDLNASLEYTALLRSLGSNDHPVDVPKHVDEHMLITLAVNVVPCETGNGTCEGPERHRIAASLNNISFHLPSVDILDAYYGAVRGIYEADFPNKPPFGFNFTGDISNLPTERWFTKRGTKVKVLEYGTAVEVVFQDTAILGAENHPMHLHGFAFYVVGRGIGNFNETTDPAAYNLIDPPFQNTVTVPKAGWAAIRFRAANPIRSVDADNDYCCASILHEYNASQTPVHRGSVKGRSKNLPRNRVEGHLQLHKDYFHRTDPVFKEKMFWRRYRMSRDLFMVILRGIRDYYPYFQCRPDATDLTGPSPVGFDSAAAVAAPAPAASVAAPAPAGPALSGSVPPPSSQLQPLPSPIQPPPSQTSPAQPYCSYSYSPSRSPRLKLRPASPYAAPSVAGDRACLSTRSNDRRRQPSALLRAQKRALRAIEPASPRATATGGDNGAYLSMRSSQRRGRPRPPLHAQQILAQVYLLLDPVHLSTSSSTDIGIPNGPAKDGTRGLLKAQDSKNKKNWKPI
ncbi:hypothetical protein QYE76_020524 [Lolium multiflorum]|uniref:Laccase n=1 Tax=Lolium multiflorum TaxID=4521 RepID=A0AAD8R621_LOLMU|nr:hypothetical protein QYE76_020524 [Lolium multiflorum]